MGQSKRCLRSLRCLLSCLACQEGKGSSLTAPNTLDQVSPTPGCPALQSRHIQGSLTKEAKGCADSANTISVNQ